MMMPRRFRPPEQLLLPWSPKNTISVTHTAEIMDCSNNTVIRMIEDGTIKAYKLHPKKITSPWRVNYDSVIEHIKNIHEVNGLETRF
jgi:excisionase family DNA binding protein